MLHTYTAHKKSVIIVLYYVDVRIRCAETTQLLRLLNSDLANEPLNIDAPDDVDIYGGDATSVATDDVNDR